METITYIRFEPDSQIKNPKQEMTIILLLKILYILLISTLFLYALTMIEMRPLMQYAFSAVMAIYVLCVLYIAIDDYRKKVTIRSDGFLILPRKKLNIRELTEVHSYKEDLIIGERQKTDVTTKDGKIYTFSISDTNHFMETLKEINPNITIVTDSYL